MAPADPTRSTPAAWASSFELCHDVIYSLHSNKPEKRVPPLKHGPCSPISETTSCTVRARRVLPRGSGTWSKDYATLAPRLRSHRFQSKASPRFHRGNIVSRGVSFIPPAVRRKELVLAKTNAIQQELRGMESRGELRLLPARREWYGPDECHLRFRKSREAIAEWLDLLLCIDRAAPHVGKPIRPISSESLYLRCHPEYRLFHFRSPERRPFVIAPGATVHSF